jgi:hypothetical protein
MKKILTSTAEYTVIEEPIYLCRMLEGAEVDVKESDENFMAMIEISESQPYAVLVDARVPTTITKEAREKSGMGEQKKNLIAMAIVVTSLANRIVGNFIIRFHALDIPTKLFSDYDEALNWLREIVKTDRRQNKKHSLVFNI